MSNTLNSQVAIQWFAQICDPSSMSLPYDAEPFFLPQSVLHAGLFLPYLPVEANKNWPAADSLPIWNPGQPNPAGWPSHIHIPRCVP